MDLEQHQICQLSFPREPLMEIENGFGIFHEMEVWIRFSCSLNIFDFDGNWKVQVERLYPSYFGHFHDVKHHFMWMQAHHQVHGQEAGNIPLLKRFDTKLKRCFDLQFITKIREHQRAVVAFHRVSLMDSPWGDCGVFTALRSIKLDSCNKIK